MKKLILSLLLLTITFSYAQFEANWEINLRNDHHKETITLTKNGNKVTGTLIGNGKLTAIYNENENTLIGYFKYKKKLHKFNAFFKNTSKKSMLVGKYCACGGEPDKFISFVKQKEYTNSERINDEIEREYANINMQGTWSSTFGELRLHQNGKKITGDYKHVGVINGVLKNNIVKGTFTNGSSSGIFEWKIGYKKFTGKWAWKNGTLKDGWNGTLTNNAKPALKTTSETTNSSLKGNYKITITNLYTHLINGKYVEENVEMYGLIGVRLKGKNKSRSVEIPSIGNKRANVWNIKRDYAIKTRQKSIANRKRYHDPTGVKIHPVGKITLNLSRTFKVTNELANNNLIVNIQTNIADSNLVNDTKFKWKQRNLFLKDMQLGKEYLLVIKNGDDKVAVGYTVEKI